MSPIFLTDPREHLRLAEAFLMQDRVFNMHQLRFLTRAAADWEAGASKSEYRWGTVVTHAAGVVASALCTSRAGVFVSPHDGAYTQALVDGFSNEHPARDVIAHGETAWRVARALGEFKLFIEGSLYALRGAPHWDREAAVRDGCVGVRAVESDFDLIFDWCCAFIVECQMKETRAQTHDNMRRRLDAGQLYLLVHRGTPVAFAGGTAVGSGIGSIGPVYTLPSARSRGLKFGQRITAFTCDALVEKGCDQIVLMADDHNPVSNAAYQRIGFHNRGAFLHLERVQPA
jgi:ribosomal protein S18 acetylase RimI-like enzyme